MTSADDDDEQPTRAYLIGRDVEGHRVHALIRATPSSDLFRATSLVAGTSVIMKVLSPTRRRDPGAIAAMSAEAAIMRRVGEHPGILGFVESIVLAGYGPAIVLPDLGEDVVTLTEHVRGRLPLGADEAINLLVQLCDGVEHVHARGVIHRDIKPDNILVVRRPFASLRLIDFGAAIVKGDPSFDGGAHGTLRFMAPETARRVASELDERVDLYSVGVLLYWLTTGSYPYRVTSIAELRCLVSAPRPPSEVVRGLPESLSVIALSLVSLDPAGRPSSAAAVARALRSIAALAGTPQSPTTFTSQDPTFIHPLAESAFPEPPNRAPSRRRAVQVAGGVATVLVVAAAVLVVARPGAPAQAPMTSSAPSVPPSAAASGGTRATEAPAAATLPAVPPQGAGAGAATLPAVPPRGAGAATRHPRTEALTPSPRRPRTACADPLAPCGSPHAPRRHREPVTSRGCDDERAPCGR